MPFKPAAQIKCPRCAKSVYAAEARKVGDDLSFHKECFKCSMCNKMLDSTNLNCHETVLYCKTCHGRKFGPKGYGFGGGAAGLSMDTGAHLDARTEGYGLSNYKPPKAPPGEGCPRCGGRVFAAEEMLAKGKAYHRTCFNCKSCRKPLDAMLHCDGPDKEVYCRGCYAQKFGPQGYGFGHGAGTLTSKGNEFTPMVRPHGNPDFVVKAKDGDQGCPRCGGVVYSAECMMAKDRGFHKKCFKCLVCTRPLDSMTHCDGADGEVYCKLCYAKKYGPKGYGFAAGGGGVLTAENIPGGEITTTKSAAAGAIDVTSIKAAQGEGCPRCGGKVFMAEEINARGRAFHKRCYNCCICHRPLDSVVGCDSPDGEVYCKLCYAKRYGPKGYGFAAGGGGVMVAENIAGNDALQVQQVSDFARLDVSKIRAKDGEGCPRCGGKVFMAEEMHARGRSFHKRCYNCCHCHRPLDSVSGCDSPDGEVYCRLCYSKKYGPKGYGFAAGGGGVLTAENIPGGDQGPSVNVNPTFAAIDTTCIKGVGEENCPRCGGKVFSAEERLSGGGIKWHKRCYSCRNCHRPLDSMVLCDGPDGDIYCKLCYAKRFGPKGYGFAVGQGGVLVPENVDYDDNEEVVVRSQYSQNAAGALDVTRIQAKDGQSRCPRCGGAVFQAEAIPVRGKQWHKPCYNCCECHRPLDSMTGNDAPDGEVYCRLCYAKRHGPKGYGYGHCPSLISLGTADGTPIPTDIRQFGFGPKIAQGWVPPGAFLTRGSQDRLDQNAQQQTTTEVSKQTLPDGSQVTRTVTQVKTTQPVQPVVAGVRIDASGKPVPIVSGVVSESETQKQATQQLVQQQQQQEEDEDVEIVYEEVEEGDLEGDEEVEYVEEIIEEEEQAAGQTISAGQTGGSSTTSTTTVRVVSQDGGQIPAEMLQKMAQAQSEFSQQVSSSSSVRIQSSSSTSFTQQSFSMKSGMISSELDLSEGVEGEMVSVQNTVESNQH
ncbi:uncharacterized protein LOC108679169 isoform X3 [Hyalella azteca]|uniref:Uncharacterized protein LOC108679169 isoform X3 n=1 Tax=Hyalella azteca TaxID=294128 RepID=A0A8B7PDA9_HYAAZ|nr:uncharacterized protein LOC108679169 isoform X3 [Hyalella azteca]